MEIDRAELCVTNPPTSAPLLDDVRVLVLFGGGRLFGQERGNLEVFRQLAKLGLRARFITSGRFGHSGIQPELDRLGFEWTTAPFGYHWGKYIFGRYFYYIFFNLYGVAVTSWRMWREARRWQPTHLYVMNWMFYTYAAPAIWLSNLPLVYRAGDELPVHTFFHRWLTRRLFRRVTTMVCISKYILARCAVAGMSRARMRVIYNYPPKRSETTAVYTPIVSEGAVIITYVGQVSKSKGIVVLLDAVEKMIKEGRNVVLWVIGEPSWGDELLVKLQQRVVTSGLNERIIFFGYVTDIFPLLRRSDIHVCPTLMAEPLSNVVSEAKLCGKPSVVFPSGGLPELIEHGVDGYICRTHTVEALLEGIEFFLVDETRRLAAGLAAQRSLEEKFALNRYREAWRDVFAETRLRA